MLPSLGIDRCPCALHDKTDLRHFAPPVCPPVRHGHEPGGDRLQSPNTVPPHLTRGEPRGNQRSAPRQPLVPVGRGSSVSPGKLARGHVTHAKFYPHLHPLVAYGCRPGQRPRWTGSRHRTEFPAGLPLTQPGTGCPAPRCRYRAPPVPGAAGGGGAWPIPPPASAPGPPRAVREEPRPPRAPAAAPAPGRRGAERRHHGLRERGAAGAAV